MKTLLSYLLLLLTCSLNSQNTFVVDSSVPVDPVADFTNLQDAIDNAADGDNIYLIKTEANLNSSVYNIDKRLNIYSKGNNRISLNLGANAHGTLIEGLTLGYISAIDTKKLIIRNCKFELAPSTFTNCDSLLFQNNWINGISNDKIVIENSANIYIANNLFHCTKYNNFGFCSSCDNDLRTNNSSGIFLNNTVTLSSISLQNFSVLNNIFYKTGSFLDCNVSFNVFQTNYSGGSNNIIGVDFSDLFTFSNLCSTSDGTFVLKANSPASGTCYGDDDCGAYGGDQPYSSTRYPDIPEVYELIVQPSSTIGQDLNISIKARSNN